MMHIKSYLQIHFYKRLAIQPNRIMVSEDLIREELHRLLIEDEKNRFNLNKKLQIEKEKYQAKLAVAIQNKKLIQFERRLALKPATVQQLLEITKKT